MKNKLLKIYAASLITAVAVFAAIYFLLNVTKKDLLVFSSAYVFITSFIVFFTAWVFKDYEKNYNRVLSYDNCKERFEKIKNRYEDLINSISDLILIISTEGDILYANDRTQDFLGKDSFDLIGLHFTDILYDKSQNPLGVPMKKISRNEFFVIHNEFTDTQFELKGKDDKPIWVDSRCEKLVDEKGDIIGFDVVIRNISGLKKKEERLKIDKVIAERANDAKSMFLANMSHELRTPLSSILGYAQLLEIKDQENLKENQRRYIQYIKSSGDHLLEMVNDILDLSKIEAGKIKIDKKPFDLNMMLSRSPSTIKAISDKKNIDLVLNIEENLGSINADEIRIKQVVYNLLSNAIKFTEPGNNIGIDAYGENDWITIQVWDSGCGIEKNDIKKIFAPFEQIENEVTKKAGTGLGLSISKQLIELHGGSISAESEVGKGTRITIKLPGRISNQSENDGCEKNYDKCSGENCKLEGKVALVEDDKQVGELISYFLKNAGCEVVQYSAGEDLLKDVNSSEEEYNLYLIDIGLPGISGVETLEKINFKLGYKAPAIALTGYAMKGDREKFLSKDFSDYISKPFRVETLMVKSCKNLKLFNGEDYEKQKYSCG